MKRKVDEIELKLIEIRELQSEIITNPSSQNQGDRGKNLNVFYCYSRCKRETCKSYG